MIVMIDNNDDGDRVGNDGDRVGNDGDRVGNDVDHDVMMVIVK